MIFLRSPADILAHLFHPRFSNNHRARLIHPEGYLVFFLFLLSFSTLSQVFNKISAGAILGYSSTITTSQVVGKTNQERTALGLPTLTVSEQLSRAAKAKAEDMFAEQYWAHYSPSGKSPWEFMRGAGYTYSVAGENLARDFAETPDMMRAWMNSPTHRENIINPKYQEIGIAVVNGKLNGVETTLVVQMFGTTQVATPQVSSANDSVIQRVFAQEEQAPASVSISPFDVRCSISLAFVILIVATLAFDWLIVWRRNLIRLSGKTWAHLTYFLTLLAILILLKQGLIL